ncbi:SAV_6107 family HEPN domain-containing protein [Streptomyces sp.]|uniref:SAV_6107 family HEPN domain-containing protein n=1 Tax=Streptomyces sp. TaxID=1931 RepID=UPI0039C9A638
MALQERWARVSSQGSTQSQRDTTRDATERDSDQHMVGYDAMPPSALDLISQAHAGLREAAVLVNPNERYATAHLAALRAAAAVLAVRRRPEETSHRRRRIRSVWEVLPEVAPELAEWGALFAAGAVRRARAEAGIPGAVSTREADDLMRDVAMFVRIVEQILPQRPAPDLLELTENQDTGAAVRHLSLGFDELFRALGPPPPGIKQRQPVPDGGGGRSDDT